MPETDIRTLVEIETDDAGVNDARRQLKQVVKEQMELVDAFKRGERDAKQFNDEMAKLVRQERDLEKAIDAVTGEFSQQREEMERLGRAAESAAQQRFDAVSRDVALAGDVESNLRTVGGALGAAGLGGAERAIGGVAEIPALAEALPKLKEAAAGLPEAITAMATSLGPMGIAATAAAAAIALAVAWFQRQTEAAKELARQRSLAEETVGQFIASGATISEAEQRIAELKRLAAEEQRLLNETLEEREREQAARRDFRGGVLDEELRDEAETIETEERRRKALQETRTEIEELTAALDEGRFSADDAVEVEKELAKARDEAEQTIKRVAQAERRAAQERERDTAGQRVRAAHNIISRIARDRREAREQAEAENDKLLQVERDFQQKELEARQEFADRRFELQLDNFRDTQDSIRDFNREFSDALGEGNFLALRDIAKADQRAAEDRKIDLRRANEDINRDALRAQQQLQDELRRAREKMLAEQQQGINQVINGFSSMWGRLAALANQRTASPGVGLFPRAG